MSFQQRAWESLVAVFFWQISRGAYDEFLKERKNTSLKETEHLPTKYHCLHNYKR